MAKQTFTTGQVLTAAQMTSLQQTAMGGGAATAKTASYVLVAADAGTTVAMNAAGATTITVNTGLFAAGDTVFIQNLGAGACTVTAGTATVATAGSLILPQNDAGILYFTATGTAIFYDYIQTGAVSPLTTKGDLYGFSTSDARIPIGANNTVLTADSTQSLGLKWAAASASGMTLINRTAFSAQSSVTLNSVFSDTYENYFIAIQAVGSNSNHQLKLQLRYTGNVTTTSGYNYSFIGTPGDASTVNYLRAAGAAQINLGLMSTGSPNVAAFNFFRPDAAGRAYFTGGLTDNYSDVFYSGGAFGIESGQVFTGLVLTPTTGTITGQISIYGRSEA